MHSFLFALMLIAALGSGLMAGVFFAFSTFIMRALARLPTSQGISAMKSINVAVLNVPFLGVFTSTAAACLAALLWVEIQGATPVRPFVRAGAASYLMGIFLVTAWLNVPLNTSLAKLSPEDPEAAIHWARYVRGWTAWNHVRTAAGLTASAAFILALCA